MSLHDFKLLRRCMTIGLVVAAVLGAILASGCDRDTSPTEPTPSQEPTSGQPPAPEPTPTVEIVDAGGTTGCATCLTSGVKINGISAKVTGLENPRYEWRLIRYGKTVATSTAPTFNSPAYLPGDHILSLRVSDATGRAASARKAFTVMHASFKSVPWSIYAAQEPNSDQSNSLDYALKLVELISASYDRLWHDWVAAEFIDPRTGQTLWLFNRVKKVRFSNRMADILYALVISGDADWWSGNASNASHWNLAAGSADRQILRNYVLVSVARIDYPPQHAGDGIHYYK